ncbi:aldo/keto reductase [Stakelama pacifica]|uniref:2,5-diketo-D-gluconate reductase A n=1 Tax=Stakelama pacifica TaxID=517720 RepID=A0A4R6FUL0_9SPHN|nr:aldo/keto reductase [Stakelama pacifica]MAW98634.1 oxidoreductase [Sphingomonas sp.]TDN85549.1 2,5-diketo-D-gluconate reductase A [Stakelama pacifica]GGO92319.1 oxidoreductase [Stakelama pacifica]
MTDTPMLDMNDGRRIPALGLGTYKIPDSQAAAAVREGLDLGYRLIDTAAAYDNERGVGSGFVSADDAFLTTKLWNDRQGHSEAIAAFEESLALLGRDHVDLYLIHWPCAKQGKFVDTWKALIELRDSGRAKSIGVSNFLPEHLDAIIDATGVVPAVNQIELHPHHQQRDLTAYHRNRGIVTQAWTPLGRGAAFEEDAIRRIAEKHGKSPAQVIIRWHIDKGHSAIPKAASLEHRKSNLDVLDWSLSDDEIAAIDALEKADGAVIGRIDC